MQTLSKPEKKKGGDSFFNHRGTLKQLLMFHLVHKIDVTWNGVVELCRVNSSNKTLPPNCWNGLNQFELRLNVHFLLGWDSKALEWTRFLMHALLQQTRLLWLAEFHPRGTSLSEKERNYSMKHWICKLLWDVLHYSITRGKPENSVQAWTRFWSHDLSVKC